MTTKPKFAVQAATFSEAIHVGRLDVKGQAFADKADLTDMVLAAVAQYAREHFDGGLTVDFPRLGIEMRVEVRAIEADR